MLLHCAATPVLGNGQQKVRAQWISHTVAHHSILSSIALPHQRAV